MFIRLIKRIFLILIILSAFSAGTSFAQNSDRELFSVAQKAFEDGFYDVAIRYIEQFMKEFPENEKLIQAKLLLGQCYFFKAQYLKAYDVFQGLLQYSEFKDATLFWLGETYLKGSDYSQAETQYQQLIKLFPNSIYAPQAYYSLGWVYFENNDFKESKKIFSELITQFPTHQLTEDAAFKLAEIEYNLHNYAQAIDLFKKYILTYVKSTRHAQAYFYTAESYYYLKDYLNAVTYYAKAAEIAYDDQIILMSKVSLGWSYLKLEKWHLAEKAFQEALDLAQQKGLPQDDIFLGQATLYAESQENQKALDAYTDLIQSSPDSPRIIEALLGQGNTLYLLERYEEAVQSYQKLIAMPPESFENPEIMEKAYFGMAWSLLKTGKLDESILFFKEIKDKTNSQAVKISALTQIGDAFQDAGELAKAVKIYDEILRDYPGNPYIDYVQYRQGVALLKMDNIEAALLSFQSLETNFPKSTYIHDIRYYLAVAYFKKESWAMAKSQISTFLEASDENLLEFQAEAYYILALSEYNLSQYTDSIKAFQKLIKNFPEQTSMIKNAELGIAKAHYKNKNYGEALKQFKRILQTYSKSEVAKEALTWIGDYYLEKENYYTAITYFEQFLEDYPQTPEVPQIYLQIGQARQALEEYHAALEAYNKVSASDEKSFAKAKLAIADIFSKDMEPQKALETYKNILKSSAHFKREALVKIAHVHKGQKEYAEAVKYYQQAIEAPKSFGQISNAELQFLIADAYELLKNPEKAIEEYLKIAYLYPNKKIWIVKAYLRCAKIFENQEKWKEAETIYNKIIDLNVDESKYAQERLDVLSTDIVE